MSYLFIVLCGPYDNDVISELLPIMLLIIFYRMMTSYFKGASMLVNAYLHCSTVFLKPPPYIMLTNTFKGHCQSPTGV